MTAQEKLSDLEPAHFSQSLKVLKVGLRQDRLHFYLGSTHLDIAKRQKSIIIYFTYIHIYTHIFVRVGVGAVKYNK